MNKLQIFLEDYELELDDSVQLNISYRYSNLVNPEDITGDYTKTITIKGTERNNRIFGLIYRFDRKILFDNSTNTRVAFNASKRTSAKIFINNTLFKSGYIKLNNINLKDNLISYEITFYSALCGVLNTMLERKLVDLPFKNDLSHAMNKIVINSFWNNTNVLSSDMTYVMTNSGMYDDFSSDKWVKDGEIVPIIADGLNFDETMKGEYRSQYQRPALKISNIIDKIASSSNITLDNSFFNVNNPYYNKTYVVLPRIDLVKQDLFSVSSFDATEWITINPTTNISSIEFDLELNDTIDGLISNNEINWNVSNTKIKEVNIEAEIEIKCIVEGVYDVDAYAFSANNSDNSISIDMLLLGNNTKPFVPYSKYDSHIPPNTYPFEAMFYLDAVSTSGNTTNMNCVFNQKVYTNYKPANSKISTWPVHYHVDTTNMIGKDKIHIFLTLPSTLKFMIKGGYESTTARVLQWSVRVKPISQLPIGSTDAYNYYPSEGINGLNAFYGNPIKLTYDYEDNSYLVDKTKIINNEITQGDFMISLSKLFGWIWDSDTDGNITIKTRNQYFNEESEILDWSNKIDRGQDINITPITFSNRYLTMKYQDGETYYENYYNNKHGVEYGIKKINTGFEFNDNEVTINEDNIFTNTICSNETTIINLDGTTTSFTDEKTLPALFDKGDDYARKYNSNDSLNLVFDLGLVNTTKPIHITDNTPLMITNDEYCWLSVDDTANNNYKLTRYSYRKFGTFDEATQSSLDIGYPLENYEKLSANIYQENATIYNSFWNNYINEIYNVNNRRMVAYFNLDNSDIATFKFNKLISIDGTLWRVNEIFDYNPINYQPTKVELVQVSSTAAIQVGYKNGQKNFIE